MTIRSYIEEGRFHIGASSENEVQSDATPWSEFVKFTQRVVSVPKEEIDEEAKKHEAEKAEG